VSETTTWGFASTIFLLKYLGSVGEMWSSLQPLKPFLIDELSAFCERYGR